MNDHENILLAVDGSPSSRSAAFAAAHIASAKQWGMHAVYVVDITQAVDIYSNIDQELSELGDELPERGQRISLLEEQGNLALVEVRGICNSLNVQLTTDMVAGNISTIMLETAPQYSLLALGRQGNRHKDSQHLGSNFRQIAHHVETSLLIGGRKHSPQNIQRVLLAYDGSEFSHQALKWIESLQATFKKVMTLSIEKEHESNHEWLAARKQEISNSTLKNIEFMKEHGEPGPTIASTASSRQADLIVMGGYRHTLLPEWAMHSTLNKVLRESDVPVLAAK